LQFLFFAYFVSSQPKTNAMLRSILLFSIIVFSCNAYAQEPTTAQVKAKKIKSKIVTYVSESPTTMIYNYDANGYDTAVYYNTERTDRKVITYNAKGKPTLINDYDKNDNLKEVTTYTYKADGSSSAANKDTQFGLVTHYKYDKDANLTELTTPDGVVRKYSYNAKGGLTMVKCISNDPSESYTTTYTYNAKGQMTGSATKSGDNSSGKNYYEFGSNGLISKVKSTPTGKASVTYEFRF
jgi:YD repeat-containing protein